MIVLGQLKEWLTFATEFSATIIDAIALVIVVVGTLEAAIKGNIVADFPLCNKSFNCSYSGHDL